jgi:hypothetical protein
MSPHASSLRRSSAALTKTDTACNLWQLSRLKKMRPALQMATSLGADVKNNLLT